MLSLSIASQTSTSGNHNVELVNISIAQDTLASGNNYKLSFKVHVQYLDSLKSMQLLLMDQGNTQLQIIGTYDLKLHTLGFYYLENSSLEKRTILNNEIFFTIPLNSATYNLVKKIQLNSKSKLNKLTSTDYTTTM
jgi:hypothetical protein